MKRKTTDAPETGEKKERSSSAQSGATWEALGLTDRIAAQVASMGFAAPTSVQKCAVPAALSGSDLMFRARTGSGKTLAYLLPLAQRLYDQRLTRADGTIAFILAPTRELATQIFGVASNLLRPFHWLLCTAITGGERRKAEKARLRKGVTVVVGTPGRLLDHVRHTASWKFSGVQTIVLDEADRLVELGQEEDVQAILKAIQQATAGKRPQGILTSATLAPSAAPLKRLSGILLQSPTFIDESNDIEPRNNRAPPAAAAPPPPPPLRGAAVRHEDSDSDDDESEKGEEEEEEEEEEEQQQQQQDDAGDEDEEGDKEAEEDAAESAKELDETGAEAEDATQFNVPSTLEQHFTIVPARLRLLVLLGFLRREAAKTKDSARKVLLFTNTTAAVDFYSVLLAELMGKSAVVSRLHGSMDMPARRVAVRNFSASASSAASPLSVLVATDVAARGLDFGHVDTVLLYDPPTSPVDYIHRIGRTARAGRTGSSHIFLLPSEAEYVPQILTRQLGLSLHRERLAPCLIAAIGEARGGRPPPLETNGEAFLLWAEKATRGAQIAVENVALPHATAAKAAFRAAVRAYATFPKNLRHIFQMGKLHLGHLARSFALRDAPSKLKTVVGKSKKKASRTQHGGVKRKAGVQAPRPKKRADVDEFGG